MIKVGDMVERNDKDFPYNLVQVAEIDGNLIRVLSYPAGDGDWVEPFGVSEFNPDMSKIRSLWTHWLVSRNASRCKAEAIRNLKAEVDRLKRENCDLANELQCVKREAHDKVQELEEKLTAEHELRVKLAQKLATAEEELRKKSRAPAPQMDSPKCRIAELTGAIEAYRDALDRIFNNAE